MKLRDIQEARYYVHPVVTWIESKIRSNITKKVCLSHDDLDPPKDEHQLMLREIIKEFGNPKEEGGVVEQHIIWEVKDYKIHLFLWDYDSKTKKHIDEPRVGVCIHPPGDDI